MDDKVRIYRLAVRALLQLAAEHNSSTFNFETADLTARINRLAADGKVTEEGGEFTNSRKTGWILKHLGLQKATAGRTKRRWKMTASELKALELSHGIATPLDQSAGNAANAEPSSEPTFRQGPVRHFTSGLLDAAESAVSSEVGDRPAESRSEDEAPVTLDPELSELIQWFEALWQRLPREPFWLSSWCLFNTSAETAEFYASCKAECEAIRAGDSRAEGWLKGKLRRLHELFGERL